MKKTHAKETEILKTQLEKEKEELIYALKEEQKEKEALKNSLEYERKEKKDYKMQ